ncbi:hypothetical protein EON62_04900 [archaeon]|nr:MAG: hypothetical protein EON62_04900 [archaeon]
MCCRNVAARKIQGMYQRRKTRLTFLQALRYRLELQSDMYTGELFYFDVHTGRSMEFPLRMCGTIFELHPPPDWMLRADVASDGSVTYSYRRPRIPRTLLVSSFLPRGARKTRNRTEKDDQVVLLLPPSGYAMCQACGINFCHKYVVLG